MAIPEHRRRAFILPEQITGHPLRSICFDIPDVAEYRQAFWGHIWKLGENFVWEKDSNADTRDVQAAQYWRQVLSESYTRWLNEESCDDDSCRSYPPNAPFIQWFPNDPYLNPDFVGEGYNAPAWYIATTASNIAYGSSPGDVITSLDRFPPGSLPSIIPASGLPRFRINVSGEGTVKATLTNLFGGSLIQTTVDDDPLTFRFIDVSRDTVSVPPETQTELTVEFEFTTPGAHHIDFIVISWINSSIPFLHHGGGLRKVELCGFATMPVVSPPFRFTEECGLEYYNGEEWLPVEGWDEFAPECFTGPPGAPGIPGTPGENLHLRENLATGLEQDSEPTFATPTLIHAYYRADALRPAASFYGKSTGASVHLHNAADVLKMQMGIVGANNEIDTRESPLIIRYGAGATNNRLMFFNADGSIQVVNSVQTPTAKFAIFMDKSTEDGWSILGRTGLNTGKAVMRIIANNQSGGVNDGWAFFIQGVNDATYTLAPGIFVIDRYGNVLQGDTRISRALTTATPKVTRNGYQERVTLHDESGANYRSRLVHSVFNNGSAIETMRQEVIDGNPAIGVLGAPASVRLGVLGDVKGSVPLANLLSVLDTVGWIDNGTTDSGPPSTGGSTGFPVPSPLPTIDSQSDDRICSAAEQLATIAGVWAGWNISSASQDDVPNSEIEYLRAINRDAFGGTIVPPQSYLSVGNWADLTQCRTWYILHGAAAALDSINAEDCLLFAQSEIVLSLVKNAIEQFVNFDQDVVDAIEETFRAFAGYGEVIADAIQQLPLEFWQRWYFIGLQGTSAACEDLWSVTMGLEADDWSGSITVNSGTWSSGDGYEGNVVSLDIPFHIYRVEMVSTAGVALTPTQITIENIDTTEVKHFDEEAGENFNAYGGDAPTGVRLRVDFGASVGRIFLVQVWGIGTEPTP